MRGLGVEAGKTFSWKGRYHKDMNTRDTLEVHLNTFGTFDPKLPEAFRDSSHVFLANGSPTVQAKVLDQIREPRLVFADTMDLWINIQKAGSVGAFAPRRRPIAQRSGSVDVDRRKEHRPCRHGSAQS